MRKENDVIQSTNGKLCVIDRKGTILVKPQVAIDTLYYPRNGFCQVAKDGLYGYIDMNGDLAIPMTYKQAYPFSENGLAFVRGEDGLGGYIDASGAFVIERVYDTGSTFTHGYAAVSRDGEYTYIYKNGHQAINNTFLYAGGFSEWGLAKIQDSGGSYCLMDTTSQVVLNLKEGCELDGFKEGSRVTKFRRHGREAMVNAAGDIITGFYDQLEISSYSRLNPFLRSGLWGYVNDRGEEVIPNVYKAASTFGEDHRAYVKAFHPFAEDQEWGFYINEDDEIIDENVVEMDKWQFAQRFTEVTRAKRGLSLAVLNEAMNKAS